MTDDEIRNMPSGMEMDALIAEKVMGDPRPPATGNWEPGHECWYCREVTGTYQTYEWHPRPFSGRIAAAWEVVEKMGNWHGFDFQVVLSPENVYDSKWRNDQWYEAGWYEPTSEGPEQRVVAYGHAAPEAICRAALLAVNGG